MKNRTTHGITKNQRSLDTEKTKETKNKAKILRVMTGSVNKLRAAKR